jgi:hypothetical protein
MGKNKMESRLTIGSLCVLQRWQIYTNIALLWGVIVGFREVRIGAGKQIKTIKPERYFLPLNGFKQKRKYQPLTAK